MQLMKIMIMFESEVQTLISFSFCSIMPMHEQTDLFESGYLLKEVMEEKIVGYFSNGTRFHTFIALKIIGKVKL